MLRHTFLLIYRNFKRFKSTFFINLIGLSTGMACVLFIFLWVSDELNMDKFHEKDSQLYQAMVNLQHSNGVNTERATPAILAEAIADEMPEVEYSVATTSGISMPPFSLFAEEKTIKAKGLFVGEDFFKMFTYEIIQGDENKVLLDKNSIVLSESLAFKLFNTSQNIIGKSIEWQLQGYKKQVVVSGIFKGPPPHSSDQFDFVLSFEVFKDLMGPGHLEWGNTGPSTFLLLKEGTLLSNFNAKIVGFIKSKDPTSNLEVYVRPYSDRYLFDKFENGVQAGGRIEYVSLFSIIAIFILVIACINFMNLSTAKASRRLKEVGIKKAIGADRKSLIIQYISESLSMAFLSLIIAVIIGSLILPQFNEITGKQLALNFEANLLVAITGITLITGIIAGSYPAFYLSSFNPTKVLKGKLKTSVGEMWARKGLVVFQYTLSIILIAAVLVVYKQVEYIQSKNLGYSKDNVIIFEMEGKTKENSETFLAELRNIPGIVSASSTSHKFIGGQTTTSGLQWEGSNPEDVVSFEIAWVNQDLIETLDIEMANGRSFSREFSADSTNIIFNEAAVNVMGIDDPIGKVINLWGDERQIIGVTKNFHFESLHEEVKPLFFLLEPEKSENVVVKIEAGREREAIVSLQEFYEVFNPGFTFDYKFLDADYQALYQAEQRVSTLSKYFAGLAILISCLGLFGLAAFTAERRAKEIGIRKILGSSEFGIVYLLSSDFTKMVIIAVAIALPVSYFTSAKWLESFAYRIDLEWWYFVGAGFMALFVAWFTVGLQTVKAARVNPVKCLQDE